jgi:hypothetical protein
MRRLSVIVVALAMLAFVAACGGSQPQQGTASQSPTLAVTFDLTVPVGRLKVTGITLTPTHLPSGVVALQTVHDGRLTTIGSHRFQKLNDTSFLVVQVSSSGVRMGWAFGDARSSCGVAFPPASSWAAGGYGGSPTILPGMSETYWDLTRAVGKPSTYVGAVGDTSAATVAASKQYPAETAYCVTVTLDK